MADAMKSGAPVVFPYDGTLADYKIDNAAEVAFTESDREIIVEPGVTITLTTNGMGIVFQGKRIKWSGGHIVGEGSVGNSTIERRPSILLFDDDGHTEPSGHLVRNLRITEANNCGIGIYRCVDVTVTNCSLTDDSGDTTNFGRQGIYVANSAHLTISENFVDGFGECIGGGGAESIASGGQTDEYTYDSYDGVSNSGDTRDVVVHANHCINPADHGIYFSDWNSRITYTNNVVRNSVTDSIKFQGSSLTMLNNIVEGGDGIVVRQVQQCIIMGNDITATGTSTAIKGINCITNDKVNYPQGMNDLIISKNRISSTNSTGANIGILVRSEDHISYSGTATGGSGTVMTDTGATFVADELIGQTIYNGTDLSWGVITDNDTTSITVAFMTGGTDNTWAASDAYEVSRRNLDRVSIDGNIVYGYFGKLGTSPSGIQVRMGDGADDAKLRAHQVQITNNIVEMVDDHTTANYGIRSRFNTRDLIVSGNSVSGINDIGISADGCDYGLLTNNILRANPAATTSAGIEILAVSTNILTGPNFLIDFDTNYVDAGGDITAYTTGSYSTSRDFTGLTPNDTEILNILETLVEDLQTRGIFR
jgi:hypothetical protein